MAASTNARNARVRKFVTRRGVELQFTELGFGGAPLGNLYRPMTEKEARVMLEAVWASGCRYFDTAPLYGLGLSETELNGLLRPKPRASYLISTKVGRLLDLCKPHERSRPDAFFETPSRRERFDYSYDGVMRSLEFSLERLGLDQVDIVFGHDVDVVTHGSKEAADARIKEFMTGGYRALDELRASGAIKAIGAGINEWDIAERLARAGDFDVFLLAGRYTLLEQGALTSFLPLCEEKKIAVVIGGPSTPAYWQREYEADAHYDYRRGAGRGEGTGPRNPAHLQEFQGQAAGSGAQISARSSLGRQRHRRRAARESEVRRNAAMMHAKLPAALWRALKAEKLVREDAPTPR